jgi:hypothetical protein
MTDDVKIVDEREAYMRPIVQDPFFRNNQKLEDKHQYAREVYGTDQAHDNNKEIVYDSTLGLAIQKIADPAKNIETLWNMQI